MKEQLRLRSVYFLKILFILINFIIPAVLILLGVSKYGPFMQIPLLKSVTFILLFFLVLPVAITYLIVSLNRIFPENTRDSFLLFFPYILNILIYSVKFGFSQGFLYLWVINSLPLFLGYILTLLIGFYVLFRSKFRARYKNKLSEIIPLTIFSLILIVVFVFSWYYMFITGTNIIYNIYIEVEALTGIIYFIFSILLVFIFHFPLLKILYKEGKL